MKVIAYRIFNQLNASAVIEVFLDNNDSDLVQYSQNRMSQFVASAAMLQSDHDIYYDKVIKRFWSEGVKSIDFSSSELTAFLNNSPNMNSNS
ncbi:hypothetical protein FNH22_18955 [Fulvivirga sp. M361]|uniref:hypothetical protein n=1 Tax=Fulvivirga sp. M361 TaxID=2594266 RepID=UPI00117A7289|nr:hypothetical protein [Fulvivirga sp. M361]TRX54835.1 hypothetical protein FNH22_18955 [Fulvivirga sp. M361]